MKKNPALVLAGKLEADRKRIQNSSAKIGKLLLNTAVVIGGYNMVRKLTKQKNLFDALDKTMGERIEIFKEIASGVVDKTK